MQIKSELPPPGPSVYRAVLDGAKCRTFRSFYTRVAKSLLFPDYFGKNLDALTDCLCSLELLGKPEVELVIKNFDEFLSKEKPEKRAAAIQVFSDAEKKENRYDGIKFRAIGIP